VNINKEDIMQRNIILALLKKRSIVISCLLYLSLCSSGYSQDSLSTGAISQMENIIGLRFSEAQRDSMKSDLMENLKYYQQLREVDIPNSIPPAFQFNPLPVGFQFDNFQKPLKWSKPVRTELPDNLEELAFWSINELAGLIYHGKVTSAQLTQMYLERLKKYDSILHCVITLTEELAQEQAQRADAEIAAGKYRGLLHGIPYGVKDLLAVKGYRTTWGALPYKDQYIDETATVVKKLEDAGAVLIAKLTMGALAWGDVWYGAKTRTPWNIEQGSSGSSAGSASATAAGLVAFAIGSETYGSIVSPSTRCGTTGLRPTYGQVSRAGAMALSWSMDKLGPICRTVEDCAIVFEVIRGKDGIDQTAVDVPFNYQPEIELEKLKIGYLENEFTKDTLNFVYNQATLEKLRELEANLIPINLPDVSIDALSFILTAEAAAAFDDLTRSGRDSLLVRQIKNAWPNVFRASRFIPAVEYIQANRVRYQLIQQMAELMNQVDIYVAPSFGTNLLLTNLTGHPCVVVPNGFNEKGMPTTISFIGQLFNEASLLAITRIYQVSTDFHLQYPPAFQ
jgi:Asp-tRNA(Asn)/Glu-tRNA(Gln) amidotransferase A subunit family amidase